jgi:hypothetical protein
MPGVVVHTGNPSTWEVKAGGLQIQGQTGLHSEIQDNLGYIRRLHLKNKTKQKNPKENIC